MSKPKLASSNYANLLSADKQAKELKELRPSFNGIELHDLLHKEGNESLLAALNEVFSRVCEDGVNVNIELLLKEVIKLEIDNADCHAKLSHGKTGRKPNSELTSLIQEAVAAQMSINDDAKATVDNKVTPYEIRVINSGFLQNVLGITYKRAKEYIASNTDMITAHNEAVIMRLAQNEQLGFSATKAYHGYVDDVISKDEFMNKVLNGFNTQGTKLTEKALENGQTARVVTRVKGGFELEGNLV